MNINVTNAKRFLSNWYFHPMKAKNIAVLRAGTTTRVNSCLPFAADHPTHLYIQAEGNHRPVPPPQVDSPEVD
jgi:hypothetical protein